MSALVSSQERQVDPAVTVREGGLEGRVDESTLVIGQEAPAAAGTFSVSAFTFWDLVRMVLVLGCVVAAIYAVFYLLKRSGGAVTAGSDAIKVIGSRSLPGNRTLYLVQVGPQVFLVGAGSESLSLISELSDRETVDALILEGGERPGGTGQNFGEMIGALVRGGQGNSVQVLRRQRERLARLQHAGGERS